MIGQSSRLRLARAAIAATLLLTTTVATAQSTPPVPASQQEFWTHFQKGDWDAAIAEAQRMLSAERGKPSPEPMRLVEALNLLGSAQLKNGDYLGAEASFKESLATLESKVGRTSGALVEPLRGLGFTLAASGRHQDALPYLDRALSVARHSYGLFDMGQQSILLQLATSMTMSGQATEAQRHLQYLMRAAQSTYGARDPRMAPVLCQIGQWYADLGVYSIARTHYRDAIAIVERSLGKADPALVEPLRALARSYTTELQLVANGTQVPTADVDPSDSRLSTKYLSSNGERALEQALAILDKGPPSLQDTLAATLVQMGDWYQIKQMPEKALPYYRRAWTTAVGLGKVEEGIVAPLSVPQMLYYPAPILSTRNQRTPAAQVDEYFVEVEFTVGPDGAVKDAKAIEHNGTARHVADTLGAIRMARFRPKFVEGEPVEASSLTFREIFRIRKQTTENSGTKAAS